MEFYRLGFMKINQNEIYWNLVAKCLIEIFGITPSAAKRKSLGFRKEIEELCKNKRVPNLIYHESPVQIASEIIRVKLLKSHLIRYQEFENTAPTNKKVVGLPSKKKNTKANPEKVHSISKKGQKAVAAKASSPAKVKRAK